MMIQKIDFATYVTEDSYSCYEIAKVMNKIFKDADVEKTIKPQMIYNYAKNKMLVRNEAIAAETLRRISKIEVTEFIVRYFERNKIEFKIVDNQDQLALFDM